VQGYLFRDIVNCKSKRTNIYPRHCISSQAGNCQFKYADLKETDIIESSSYGINIYYASKRTKIFYPPLLYLPSAERANTSSISKLLVQSFHTHLLFNSVTKGDWYGMRHVW
jgi:hypothetical protein